MDIIIKSCGRPYYLDRCLRSVFELISGSFQVMVLDDGTHPEHLNLLRAKYPAITIHQSSESQVKCIARRKHVNGVEQYNIKTIPTAFWKEHIKNASPFFLLLEEDAWITSPLHVDKLLQVMGDLNIVSTKLYWGNCAKMVGKMGEKVGYNIELTIPKLPVTSERIMRPFFTRATRIKSILFRTGLITPSDVLPYYALYTVSSAVFNRDYWLKVWEGSDVVVNEDLQLLNALRYYNLHKDVAYAKSIVPVVATSYITSSVNSYYASLFDMIRLNEELSAAWANNELDPHHDFPNDFDPAYLKTFLKEEGSKYNYAAWLKWISSFKNQFLAMGIS